MQAEVLGAVARSRERSLEDGAGGKVSVAGRGGGLSTLRGTRLYVGGVGAARSSVVEDGRAAYRVEWQGGPHPTWDWVGLVTLRFGPIIMVSMANIESQEEEGKCCGETSLAARCAGFGEILVLLDDGRKARGTRGSTTGQ
jgi:hypothetical protein